MKHIQFFNDSSDSKEIGIKGNYISQLYKKGFKVPPGFVILSKVSEEVFKTFKKEIAELFKCTEEELNEKCVEVQKKIKKYQFPEKIADEIIESYLSISVDLNMTADSLLESNEDFVAVRSSFIEDRGEVELSQKTILNVKGKDRLFSSILRCYAHSFGRNNVEYRRNHGFSDFSMAIIVQKMIDADKSGSAISVYKENPQEMRIKACYGLGEGLKTAEITPDRYVVDKKTLTVKEINVAEKQYEYVRDIDTNATVKQRLGEKSLKQVLFNNEIVEIARILKKITTQFEKQQKIEWVQKDDIFYILQAKPMEIEMEPDEENYDEPPEIIDVSEEDLEALDEIEKIENTEVQEEPSSAEVISEVQEMQNDSVEPKIEVQEEVIIENEEVVEEPSDSIFSGVISEPEDKLKELAKMNAGNTVVYCHMAVKQMLKQKLLKYSNEISSDFEKILNELVEFESIENENDLRKLNEVYTNFISKLNYPEPKEVEMALKLLR